jgi:hypothetical protein
MRHVERYYDLFSTRAETASTAKTLGKSRQQEYGMILLRYISSLCAYCTHLLHVLTLSLHYFFDVWAIHPLNLWLQIRFLFLYLYIYPNQSSLLHMDHHLSLKPPENT